MFVLNNLINNKVDVLIFVAVMEDISLAEGNLGINITLLTRVIPLSRTPCAICFVLSRDLVMNVKYGIHLCSPVHQHHMYKAMELPTTSIRSVNNKLILNWLRQDISVILILVSSSIKEVASAEFCCHYQLSWWNATPLIGLEAHTVCTKHACIDWLMYINIPELASSDGIVSHRINVDWIFYCLALTRLCDSAWKSCCCFSSSRTSSMFTSVLIKTSPVIMLVIESAEFLLCFTRG